MKQALELKDYALILDELSFDTPLSAPSVESIIQEASDGIALKKIVASRVEHDADNRTTFGTLADVQYVAQYAIAIKTIYEVMIFFAERPEVEEMIAEAERRIQEFSAQFSTDEIRRLYRVISSKKW